jgi:hypothetical protein
MGLFSRRTSVGEKPFTQSLLYRIGMPVFILLLVFTIGFNATVEKRDLATRQFDTIREEGMVFLNQTLQTTIPQIMGRNPDFAEQPQPGQYHYLYEFRDGSSLSFYAATIDDNVVIVGYQAHEK